MPLSEVNVLCLLLGLCTSPRGQNMSQPRDFKAFLILFTLEVPGHLLGRIASRWPGPPSSRQKWQG